MVQQLELVPLPPPVDRGRPLIGLRIPLAPQVAQRHRCGCIGKNRPTTYDDDEYRDWKRDAVWSLTGWVEGRTDLALPLKCLMVARFRFVFARPATESRTFTVEGEVFRHPWPWPDGRFDYAGPEDYDNLLKAPLDAMKAAGILLDDRLVVRDGGSEKLWAARGEAACVEVHVWRA